MLHDLPLLMFNNQTFLDLFVTYWSSDNQLYLITNKNSSLILLSYYFIIFKYLEKLLFWNIGLYFVI